MTMSATSTWSLAAVLWMSPLRELFCFIAGGVTFLILSVLLRDEDA